MAARAPFFAACDTQVVCSSSREEHGPAKGALQAQDGRDAIGWRHPTRTPRKAVPGRRRPA